MEHEFKNTAGICLLLGSFMAIITMVLHPSGGNIMHIIKIRNVLMFSHSIAILCLPFIGFGTWGLSQLLLTKNKISMLSFFIFCLGLIAAMIAGTINGLVLPNYLSSYTTPNTPLIKAIITYGLAINSSMASIFVAATTLSIALWSLLIMRTAQLPKWLGYYGILVVAFGMFGVILKLNFTSVFGFRLFIFGIVSWIILAGYKMLTRAKKRS